MKKANRKICLAECLHYLTRIPLEELDEAIYKGEKYEWSNRLDTLLLKYNLKLREYKKAPRGVFICVLGDEKRSHAIVVRNEIVEMNPYGVDIDKMPTAYYLKVVICPQK